MTSLGSTCRLAVVSGEFGAGESAREVRQHDGCDSNPLYVGGILTVSDVHDELGFLSEESHDHDREVSAAAEQGLVRRAQDGDTAAFADLYRAHVGRVYALCLRLAADEVRAQELTQDVFVRTWYRLSTFRGDCAFGSWLYRVATNVVMGELRSERRRDARERSAGDPSVSTVGRTNEPGGVAFDLERAIGALPVRARAVFVLHDIEGYRHDEIASMMGIAPGTAKAQLHRARRILREALGP